MVNYPKTSELKTADIIFTADDSIVSRAIRYFQRSRGEKPTRVHHTGLITKCGDGRSAVIVESNIIVKQSRFDVAYGNGKTRIWVARARGLTSNASYNIKHEAENFVGSWYGFRLLPFYLGDKLVEKLIGGNSFIFRRLYARMLKSDREVCSSLVKDVWVRNTSKELHFNIPTDYPTPNEIWEAVTQNDNYDIYRFSF